MELELKRMVEAELTKAFIQANVDRVRTIAATFSQKIDTNIKNKSLFYLKGGNSISILNGKPTEGDFDFQLVPNNDAYTSDESWANAITDIGKKIKSAMMETVNNYVGEPDVSCFDTDNIARIITECREIFNRDNPQKAIPTGTVTAVKENEDPVKTYLSIGETKYKTKNYLYVARDAARQADKRVLLSERTDFIEDNNAFSNKKFRASGYVNYTIPGFVLFRLVYKYSYFITMNGKKEKVKLKSEIIDVSVPRIGSGEVFMSQNGNITWFRNKGGFNIPGWGYHFYENINLLQEIELGISGSKHKAAKRKQRLQEAMNALIVANNDGKKPKPGDEMLLTVDDITEPNDTIENPGKIFSYFKALTYHIEQSNLYIDEVKTRIMEKIKTNTISSYFSTKMSKHQLSGKYEVFYKFKVEDSFTVRQAILKDAICRLIALGKDNKLHITHSELSPYLHINPQKGSNLRCGFDYAVITVEGQDTIKYIQLLEEIGKTNKEKALFPEQKRYVYKNQMLPYSFTIQKIEVINNHIEITINASDNKCLAYIFIQTKNIKNNPDYKEEAKNMLRNTFLESQRYPLTYLIEN